MEKDGKDEIIKAKGDGSSRIPPVAKVFRNYRNTKNKSIGLIMELHSKRIFYKMVDRKKHFHRNHRSWAISSHLVPEMNKEGVELIVLDVKEEEAIYCTLTDFEKYSIIDQYEGYEEQHFLHEHRWRPYVG